MDIVSFFKAPGATGQTTLVASVAAHLAEAGRVVVLIDADVTAPGLTFLPLGDAWIDDAARGLGFADVLNAAASGATGADQVSLLPPSKLLRRCRQRLVEDMPGELFLIDTGSPRVQADPAFPRGLAWPFPKPGAEPEGMDRLRTLAAAFRADLEAHRLPDGRAIDHVLIDCPAAPIEAAWLTFALLADRRVVLGGPVAERRPDTTTLIQEACALGASCAVVLSTVPLEVDVEAMIARPMFHRLSASPEVLDAPVFAVRYATSAVVQDIPSAFRDGRRDRHGRDTAAVADWLLAQTAIAENSFAWSVEPLRPELPNVRRHILAVNGRACAEIRNDATNEGNWYWQTGSDDLGVPLAARGPLRSPFVARRQAQEHVGRSLATRECGRQAA